MERTANPADTGVVEREIRIEADRATVFRYWTEADLVTKWMGRSATIDPRAGGTFRVDYNGIDIASGAFLEVSPPERLVLTWGWEAPGDSVPPGASRVEVRFIAAGDATIVEVRHLALPDDSVESHADGWAQFLLRLREAVSPG